MKNYFYSDREKGVIIFDFMGSTYQVPPMQVVECPIALTKHKGFQKNLSQLLSQRKDHGLKLVSQEFVDKMEEAVTDEFVSELEEETEASELVLDQDEEIEEAVETVMEYEEMTKAELKAYAEGNLGLELDPKKMKKKEMIAEIMKAEDN
jgi:hypothetical protein